MDFDAQSTIELRLPNGEPVTIVRAHVVSVESAQGGGCVLTTTAGAVNVADAYDAVWGLLVCPGAYHHSTAATPAQHDQTTRDD